MSDDNETAKSIAIGKNLERKKERDKAGNLAIRVNELAVQLANRDIELTPGQADALIEFFSILESGKEPTKADFSKILGSKGGKGERKSALGWYRNLFIIFEAGLIIDFRNRRAMDFFTREVYDYSTKSIRNMTDSEIDDLFKTTNGGDKWLSTFSAKPI